MSWVTRSLRAPLWLRFVVLGGLSFAFKRGVEAELPAKRTLLVTVPQDADDAQIERATREAMLLELAREADLARGDVLVRARVLSRMRAIEDVDADPGLAIERGLQLGLHLHDPIARSRLLARAEARLAELDRTLPDEEQIERALAARPERHQRPAAVVAEHLFFAPGRPAPAPPDSPGCGAPSFAADADPWPWTSPSSSSSLARWQSLTGDEVAHALSEAPIERWVGPVTSRRGSHYVCVKERTEARTRSVHEASPRLTREVREARRAQELERRLQALRARYDVTLERR